MRSLTYFVATSLDGFIAAPDGSFDAFPMTGDHIDALFREYPETLPGVALAAAGVAPSGGCFDTVVMGWNTFAVGLPHGLTDPYPHLRSYVCSRSHAGHEATGGAVVTAEAPVALVRRLKAEPAARGIWLCGGAALAATLEPEIDELMLKVSPILLGAGIPLFAAGPYRPRAFELLGTRAFRSGVVWSRYRRAPR
jgi:dihydrofolate reductase